MDALISFFTGIGDAIVSAFDFVISFFLGSYIYYSVIGKSRFVYT